MNKVFNIHLAGHLIAIEESAYEDLQQYIHQLKLAFTHVDEKEEIIKDISARIAELLLKKLKSEKIAIQVSDINEIKNIIGLPKDIIEESNLIENAQDLSNSSSKNQKERKKKKHNKKKKLYRIKNEKIIAGVAGGIAEYFNIDPILIRLLFFLSITIFHGVAILAYLILWIITPISEKQQMHITKRLYRDPDKKIIAGVCSGLAHYFKIEVKWIRLIAILPILLIMIPFINLGASFYYSSLTWIFSFPSFFLIYIILWITTPYPKNKIENAEMYGDLKEYEEYIDKIRYLHQDQDQEKEVLKTENQNGLWVFLAILIIAGITFLFFYTFQSTFLSNTGINFDFFSSMIKVSGLKELNLSGFNISIIIFLTALFFLSIIPIYFFIFLLYRLFNTNYKTNKTLKIINTFLIILFLLSIIATVFSIIYWISL